MKNVLDILNRVGAIVSNDHFVGTSGRHMSTYINKDKLISNPKYSSLVGKLITNKVKNKKIDIVVGPAVAGIALSQWTAYHLGKHQKEEVLALFTEKDRNNNQIFKRGFDKLIKNKNVLVVEDITTTGSSIKKVIRAVKKAKGKVVFSVVMINKDPKRVSANTLSVPFASLSVLKIPSYDKNNCPLCKTKIPINMNLGHGKIM